MPEHFAFTMGPDKPSNKYFDGALFRFPAIGKLGIAEASVQSSRAYLHQSLSTAWQKTLDGKMHSLEGKAGLLLIRQHGFVNESRYETAGQIYFGLPPDPGVVAF